MHELMMMVSGWLMNYLAHSLVVLTVLGAVAWLGDRLLRRIGPQAQHCVWVAALLTGAALPLLPSGAFTGYFGHADPAAAGGPVAVTYHMVADATARWALTPLLSQMLTGAYLLTVLFSMTGLLWRWRRTRAMVRRSAVLALKVREQGLVETAARRLGVEVPEVRCSEETHGPVVMGLRKGVLLAPESFFEATEEDVTAALTHECGHIARRDFAKNLLYEVVAVTVAYHPACRLIRRRIAETRELVCDELAAGQNERTEYAASLVRLASGMAAPEVKISHAIGVFDANILEERIMRLTMDLPVVSRTRRIAMAAVATCALLGGAATAAALSFDVTPPQDAAKSATAHEKVYKVGGDVTPPVLTYSVDAKFTKKAKDAKYQGVSVVSCVVDADGMPQHVHTVKKLGMGLDEKALEAVRQYKFKPSTLHGKPVAVQITIEVNFRLY